MFCHWGFVGAGGDPDDTGIVDAGAAFELLQAFALVHDDVMDGSAVRRGAPTAHLVHGERHHVAGWRGEERRFGEGVAILLGDLSHVYADRLVPRTHPDVQVVWDELRTELNVGQYLDLLGTAIGGVDDQAARRIARYKSGKYTIERPLHVGAALAGRFEELGAPLSAYGDPLGEAFQLRDDLIGAFGDEATTGKPVGDDLREGKPTPLMALATAAADARQATVLATVGRPDLNANDIAAIQLVLHDTGAVKAIEQSIDELTDTRRHRARQLGPHPRSRRRAHRAGRLRRPPHRVEPNPATRRRHQRRRVVRSGVIRGSGHPSTDSVVPCPQRPCGPQVRGINAPIRSPHAPNLRRHRRQRVLRDIAAASLRP